MFIGLLSACPIVIFGGLVSNTNGPKKYVILNNRPCQTRATRVNINSTKTIYYPFTLSVHKWGITVNTIDDPSVQVCVPSKVKDMNVKVSDLMSGINETKCLVKHKSCECKYTLYESLCNSKQK